MAHTDSDVKTGHHLSAEMFAKLRFSGWNGHPFITATHLLMALPGACLSFDSDTGEWSCYFMESGKNYLSANPADACAAAWIHKHVTTKA